jgi:hypothetical protein
VRVTLLSGRATIKNFTLGNPKGFRSPRAMKVASISMSLGLASLLSDTIIIRGGRVTLHTPDLPSGTAGAALPDIHMRDVGRNGAPPSEVFSRILAVLYDRLTMPIVIDTLNRGVIDARKSAEKGTRTLTDKIKRIFK